jgi:prevent-host-death family protein
MTIVSDYGRNFSVPTTIPAGEFKAKCLKLLDEVAATRQTLIITKRGKPVAEIKPIPEEYVPFVGSMRGTGEILGDIISPIDVEWEAMK